MASLLYLYNPCIHVYVWWGNKGWQDSNGIFTRQLEISSDEIPHTMLLLEQNISRGDKHQEWFSKWLEFNFDQNQIHMYLIVVVMHEGALTMSTKIADDVRRCCVAWSYSLEIEVRLFSYAQYFFLWVISTCKYPNIQVCMTEISKYAQWQYQNI